VERHQSDQTRWKQCRVQRVKTPERPGTDLRSTAQEIAKPLSDAGQVRQHAGGNGDRPIGELIPREEIAGEQGYADTGQQGEADDPVPSTAAEEATGAEHTGRMEQDHHRQEVGAPEVHGANKGAEDQTVLEVHHRPVGGARRRHIDESHECAGDDEQNEERRRRPAQTHGETPAEGGGGQSHRPQMQQEGEARRPGPLALCLGPARPAGAGADSRAVSSAGEFTVTLYGGDRPRCGCHRCFSGVRVAEPGTAENESSGLRPRGDRRMPGTASCFSAAAWSVPEGRDRPRDDASHGATGILPVVGLLLRRRVVFARLEAHATMVGGARAQRLREWCCWPSLPLPLSLFLPLICR
jgi:hypothetical protein